MCQSENVNSTRLVACPLLGEPLAGVADAEAETANPADRVPHRLAVHCNLGAVLQDRLGVLRLVRNEPRTLQCIGHSSFTKICQILCAFSRPDDARLHFL